MSSVWRALVAILVTFFARTALAEERVVGFALSSSGEAKALATCGGEDAIAPAVEERLHRKVFVPADEADVVLAIAFDADRAIIVAKDREDEELGRREVPLPSGDCPKALDTLAVVLAIMIGPERTTTDPLPNAPPETEPEPPPPPPPPPPPKKSEAPRPKKEPPAHWAIAPLAEIAVGTGVMPGVSWAIEAGAIVTTPVRRLHLIGRAEYWPRQYTPTRPTAEVDRIGGALLGCAEVVRAFRTALSICGGADAGRLATESSSFTRSSNATMVLGVLAETRFGYRFRAGGITVEPVVAAQIAANLRRDRFTYRDLTGRELTLLRAAPLGLQASFGVTVHFF